ncbi:protease HtpX [Thiosocius teredinicola]|uniref:protease HtpX n=1 Tax=Thiosocius teredinicola TaxID=1973002 RepID=UPI000990E344
MMRLLLFLGTNVAIIALISITFRVLGIDDLLAENRVDLDMNALLIYSAIIGFSGSFISLFLSKFMAKKTMGVHMIEEPQNRDEQWLLQTVKQQADAAGIKMPEVGIFQGSPNAFATGWNKNDSLVAVSTGLLQSMNRDEVEAVLAHEISHVANGDMVTLTLIQGVVNTFVVFFSRVIGHVVDRVVFKVERGHGPAFWITSLIAQFVLGILASMIVMWFSRWREYRADAGGANLAGRHKMISALRRLQQASGAQPLPDEMAAFGITGAGLKELFASHPPLEARIQALQQANG